MGSWQSILSVSHRLQDDSMMTIDTKSPDQSAAHLTTTQDLKFHGNFVKKANHLSRCVKGALRNMENVVGNFVT